MLPRRAANRIGIIMSYEGRTEGLDYYPCRYETSRTVFRGPRVALDGPFTVVLGGSEVYGKFVEEPFSEQLADRTGRRIVNLGVMNGGLDVYVQDEALMRLASQAEASVVQVMGAHNLSNRYYTVHPRRNDRFLKHSTLLNALYRDVDFSDFTFTRHMLSTLRTRSPDRFRQVEAELSSAWVARMRLLLSRLPGRRILLWIETGQDHGLGAEPPFVTLAMIQSLEESIDGIVQVDVSDTFGAAQMSDMVFPETAHAAALHSLTPAGHARIAEAVAKALRRAGGLAA